MSNSEGGSSKRKKVVDQVIKKKKKIKIGNDVKFENAIIRKRKGPEKSFSMEDVERLVLRIMRQDHPSAKIETADSQIFKVGEVIIYPFNDCETSPHEV